MIEVKLKLDMSGLSNLDDNVKAALARGVSGGSNALAENAKEDHGLGSHSKQRYVRKSGVLNRSIRQMPTTITGNKVMGGVIASTAELDKKGKEYAVAVEEGHDIKRGGAVVGNAPAYPFMKPALENKELQDEILDIVADELSKEF